MQAKTFALVLAVSVVGIIIELIRRQKLTFKYSIFWLSVSGLTVLLAFTDSLLWKLAELAGFELLSNFIFFLALASLSTLCLFLTVYINEQNSRTERLAQTIGIMGCKIKELEKSSAQEKSS